MSREKGKKLKVEENKRKEMDTVDYATRCSSDHQTSRPTWPKRLIHRHGRAIPQPIFTKTRRTGKFGRLHHELPLAATSIGRAAHSRFVLNQ
jgi:hypothetical protein